RDGLIRVRNIRALNGRFNTSITHAYSIVIGSKHITLNATGGGFLTASKQFRHGATSKSRSNTASNSTKHKSPHLRSEERFSRNAETELVCRLLLEKKNTRRIRKCTWTVSQKPLPRRVWRPTCMTNDTSSQAIGIQRNRYTSSY